MSCILHGFWQPLWLGTGLLQLKVLKKNRAFEKCQSQKPLTNLEPDVFVLYQNNAEVYNAIFWTGPICIFVCLGWKGMEDDKKIIYIKHLPE